MPSVLLAIVVLLVSAPSAFADFSLRADADRAGLRYGAAAQSSYLADTNFARLLDGQVNTITFENEAKWATVHPAPFRYDFAKADELAAWAQAHGMHMRGHTLAWHLQNPSWLTSLHPTRDQAIAILRDHITTVVEHFRDKFPGLVVQWDVVNEPIDSDGSMRRGIWQQWIGDDYVDFALRFAREAAGPNVELFVNDFVDDGMVEASGGGNSPPPPGAMGSVACEQVVKCAGLERLVTSLVQRGAPIDGVGFEAHMTGPNPSDYRNIVPWVGRLGLHWALTEMDYPIPRDAPPPARERQAGAMRTAASVCLEDPACDTIVTWGLSDRYTWYTSMSGGTMSDALPFGDSLEAKPAAAALHGLFAAAAPAAAAPSAPSTGACASRRIATLRVPVRRGERLVSMRLKVTGRPERVLRVPRRVVHVSLLGLPGPTVVVRLRARVRRATGSAARVDVRRRYRTCG